MYQRPSRNATAADDARVCLVKWVLYGKRDVQNELIVYDSRKAEVASWMWLSMMLKERRSQGPTSSCLGETAAYMLNRTRKIVVVN